MTKKQLKNLVLESYNNEMLDEKRVEHFSRILQRGELKEYIRELKSYEKKKSLVVSIPYNPTEKERIKFQELFPNKKIVYIIDPSLLLGAKIINDDYVHDLNVKNTLDNLVEYVDDYEG